MCRNYNTPPSIIKWKKVQHERVAPWKKHSVRMSVGCLASGGRMRYMRICVMCYMSEHTPVAQV